MNNDDRLVPDYPFIDLRHPPGTNGHPIDHFVELYEDEHALVTSVAKFTSNGIRAGESSVVIADRSRREAIETELDRRLDLRDAIWSGNYISLDAHQTMSRFVTEGEPDPEKFDAAAREIVSRAARHSKEVRLFGEIVAIMWDQGYVAGALALEDLWNGFVPAEPMKLFCAYPLSGFGRDDQASMDAVCEKHSRVFTPPRSNGS